MCKALARHNVIRSERSVARINSAFISCGEHYHVGAQRFCAIEFDLVTVSLPDAVRRDGVNDFELDVRPLLRRFEEALPNVFPKELARQKRMGEALVQAHMIFALVELTKCPVDEITRLLRAHGKIAGTHIEELQGIVTTEGDASTNLVRWFNDLDGKAP